MANACQHVCTDVYEFPITLFIIDVISEKTFKFRLKIIF